MPATAAATPRPPPAAPGLSGAELCQTRPTPGGTAAGEKPAGSEKEEVDL